MEAKTAKDTAQLNVTLAEDRLKAWVLPPTPSEGGLGLPTLDDVLTALHAAQIELTNDVRARARQFVELLRSRPAPGGGDGPPEPLREFLIAEGRPPVEPQDEVFEWCEPPTEHPAPAADDDGSVDYFAVNSIETFEAGAVVGRLKPPTVGEPGRDVSGRPVPPTRRAGQLITMGPGLGASPDRTKVLAQVAGRVSFEQRQLRIEKVLKIAGDVNFDSGSLDVCVDVEVRGTVRSNFSVRTTRSLIVKEAIEAAEVDVGGDITVRGGICGHECRTAVRAGGSVAARFLHESRISAAGDIRVEKECRSSHVETPGRVIGPRATIIGGQVCARESAEVAVIGSEAGAPTCVVVGIAWDDLRRVMSMEEELKERVRVAERARLKAQPLAADLARLTEEQRQVAIDLLSEADRLELAVEKAKVEHQQVVRSVQPFGRPHLIVHQTIHAGARIAIGARTTQIEEPIRGPVQIEERKVDGATEMVAVNQRSGSVTVLPTFMATLAETGNQAAPGSGDGGTD